MLHLIKAVLTPTFIIKLRFNFNCFKNLILILLQLIYGLLVVFIIFLKIHLLQVGNLYFVIQLIYNSKDLIIQFPYLSILYFL